MKSSTKNSPSLEDRLYWALKDKDSSAAQEILSQLLGENQLAMPGFDTSPQESDPQKEQRIRGVLQKVSREHGIPGDVFKMAYGRSPSLYQLVEALVSESSVDQLNAIAPQVFHLVRPARALRLNDPAHVWDHYKGGDWIVQQKMDGWYAQVHIQDGKVMLLSRTRQEFTFAADLRKSLSVLFAQDSAILECELVSLSQTGMVDSRMNMKSKANEVRAYFFDLLYWESDWTRKPYSERLEKLAEILRQAQNEVVSIIMWQRVHEKDRFVGLFNEWTNIAGLEGMIAKRPDAIYESDCMTKNFLKIKLKDTVDAVILGYINSPRSYLFGLWDEDENVHIPFVWITVPKGQRDVIAEEIELHKEDLPPLSVGDRITEVRTKADFVVEVEGDHLQVSEKFPCGKRQTGKGWTLNAANIKKIRRDKGVSDITTVESFLSLQAMAGQTRD